MTVIRHWTPEDYERMADAILRGDAVRLGASASDVQDAAEIAIERVRQQLAGAVEAERLLAAALEDDHLDPLDVGRAATKALDALRGESDDR